MGLFDFLKKSDASGLSKDEIELLNTALGSAAGKEALLDSLKDFGRGPMGAMGMGPNALLARMNQAAEAKNNSEYASIAKAVQQAGKVPSQYLAKCIEAIGYRLNDLKEGDPELNKQKALLEKLKALKH